MNSSGKHAYCIIAHNDPYCLQTLINLIDDPRNDIFILYDKKCNKNQFADIDARFSNIIFPKEEIDIYWGHYSQICAELILFETVLNQNSNYKYIHLLSGVDLPLHNQDYIHSYFNDLPNGTNLIGFAKGSENEADLKNKTEYRHILMKYYKDRNIIRKSICSVVRKTWLSIQKALKLKVDWTGYHLAKGTNWVSITQEFASYLVSEKDSIIRKFKFVRCADEIYKQTMAMSSEFKDTIMLMDDEYKGCMRMIDWKRGRPYIWRITDIDEIMRSDALFARKFQTDIDMNVINRIFDLLDMKAKIKTH